MSTVDNGNNEVMGEEGNEHDREFDSNSESDMDNVERADESEDDDSGSDGPASDAGFSEEATSAESEARQIKLRVVEKEVEGDATEQRIRDLETDLIKRAKALAGVSAFAFPDFKSVRSGDMFVQQPLPSDDNRWVAFEGLFGKHEVREDLNRPHVDTFRGRLVDWKSRIVDDRWPVVELVRALAAAGLKGHSADQVRKAFKEWALLSQYNDLIKKFEKRVPEWDGVERMEMSLIELFRCFDTELNRAFSKYFWLSLYNRVTNPGCRAEMVLSLFGAQNAGKSYFSKLICQIITGDKNADSVQLDLSGDKMEFLREITGNSIVANVGEMTGFTRGDLNKIKDFISRSGDNMHYKYEGHFTQMRQWVTILDGNKYEGLQRDDTGNRRFYPMFVGQLPDVHGQPAWSDTFKADFSGFEDKVWQMMAECRAWMKAEGGAAGYNDYVNSVIPMVAAFSRNEMSKDRGTIKDEPLDVFLIPALNVCKVIELQRRKNTGVWLSTGEIVTKVALTSRNKCDVKMNHLPPKMALLGAEPCMINNVKGYLFRNVMTKDELVKHLRGPDTEEDEAIQPDKVVDSPDDDSEF
jgi:Virulence-associated protein E